MACNICGEKIDLCEYCDNEIEGDFYCYEEVHFCSEDCWKEWLVIMLSKQRNAFVMLLTISILISMTFTRLGIEAKLAFPLRSINSEIFVSGS